MKQRANNYILNLFACLIFILSSIETLGQGVNGYGEVTAIAGSTITVANVSEADDTFEDGEYIIIMQMQDNVIGNTTNTASFGTLGAIQSAGLYEVRQIQSHTEASGLPATITVFPAPSNTYNLNSNASVQIVSFPTLGTPNYTTIADMSPPDWDGTTGGVLAFEVPGVLTLAHNINADFTGFRGGGADPNATTTAGSCQSTVFITTASGHALKGEGIFKSTVASHSYARAKILNGGGGGSGHNGGGAGGGNYTAGGDGGIGYSCRNSATQSVGGQGGLSLSAQISATRFFLGGGGGAGEQNNSAVTLGGDGGGIIIVKADEIITTGTCAGGLTISSNGETKPDIGNDGGPGGGAGGSIFLDVNTFTIAAGCAVSVEANGGDGSTAVTGTTHAGGGGGGQGVVIYSIPEPTTNITTTTISGSAGCDNSSSPCNSDADPGAGTTDDGIIPSSPSGPLPVTLAFFTAEKNNDSRVSLKWKTMSESNNDYFQVEKSIDGSSWRLLTKITGAGNSTNSIKYQAVDLSPQLGINYYRLTQVDFDGTATTFNVQSVIFYTASNKLFVVYPNPTNESVFIKPQSNANVKAIELKNLVGQLIAASAYYVNGTMMLDLSALEKGVYLLTIQDENGSKQTTKVIVK